MKGFYAFVVTMFVTIVLCLVVISFAVGEIQLKLDNVIIELNKR